MLKIAFLFLTISNVYHENHWRDFFAGYSDYYSVYLHAKESVSKNSFFKPYEITTKVPTAWANTMRAQIELLKTALADPDNEKFIFISESTIPLADFDTAYTHLMRNDLSIFYFRPNPHVNTNGDFSPQPKRNLAPIPANKQFKSTQWVVLNRKHAQLMVQDDSYLNIIANYPCDNEHYPATFLLNNNLFDEIDPHDVTYVEWRKPAPKHPYAFTNLQKNDELEALLKAQEHGYLFARKIAQECDLTALDPFLSYRTPKDSLIFEDIQDAFKKLMLN